MMHHTSHARKYNFIHSQDTKTLNNDFYLRKSSFLCHNCSKLCKYINPNVEEKKINNLSFQPLRKLTGLQYYQSFLFLRNFLRMSFLSSRLFPLTRIVSLKARRSLLPGISLNSTSAASKETLLLSDSCVIKLRDICDGQFLRVTVSRIYNSLAHIEQNNFLTQPYTFQLHFTPLSELRFKIC